MLKVISSENLLQLRPRNGRLRFVSVSGQGLQEESRALQGVQGKEREVDVQELRRRRSLKRPVKTIAVFGCFDLLHLGHIFFFEKAKRAGGGKAKLVVVVARDSNARRVKGKAPFFNENERVALLKNLRCVDSVILGGKKDLFAVLRKVKPDVIVLGFDQRVDERKLEEKIAEFGLKAKVKRLQAAFKPRRHKSGVLKKFFGL